MNVIAMPIWDKEVQTCATVLPGYFTVVQQFSLCSMSKYLLKVTSTSTCICMRGHRNAQGFVLAEAEFIKNYAVCSYVHTIAQKAARELSPEGPWPTLKRVGDASHFSAWRCIINLLLTVQSQVPAAHLNPPLNLDTKAHTHAHIRNGTIPLVYFFLHCFGFPLYHNYTTHNGTLALTEYMMSSCVKVVS